MIKLLIRTTVLLTILGISTTKSQSQETGLFIIESNVQDFLLVIDNDFENYLEVKSGDVLELEIGERSFRMVGENFNDNLFSETILGGEVVGKNIQVSQFTRSPLSSYETLLNQSNLEIFTDEESTIFINDELIGTGYSKIFLDPGKYDLLIEHPNHGSLKKSFEASFTEPLIISRYNEKPRSYNNISALIPGYGYLQNKEYQKARYTYGTFGILLAGIIYSELRYDYINNRINDQIDVITSPENPDLVLSNSRHRYYSQGDLDRELNRSNLLKASMIGVYLITTIDGLRKPKQGYWAEPRRTELSLSHATASGTLYPELKMKIQLNR